MSTGRMNKCIQLRLDSNVCAPGTVLTALQIVNSLILITTLCTGTITNSFLRKGKLRHRALESAAYSHTARQTQRWSSDLTAQLQSPALNHYG